MTTDSSAFFDQPIQLLVGRNFYLGHIPFLPQLKTWREMASLGKENLAVFILRLRREEKDVTKVILRHQELIDMLGGKLGKDFKTLALEFENPTGIQIKRAGDRIVEPTDEESLSRSADTTTFNMCGWCKYSAGSGVHMGRVNLTPECNLTLPKYEAPRFDSPCILPERSAGEIGKYLKNHTRFVRVYLHLREEVRQVIQILQELSKDAPDRPLLPTFRSPEHFTLGEEVVVYVPPQMRREGMVGVWAPARILARPRDSLVTVMTAPVPHLVRRSWDIFDGHPNVLKRRDFEYFKRITTSNSKASAFLDLWLSCVRESLTDFESIDYLNEILNGQAVSV